jgi:ApeA N-terminal domain 1/Apea-like HEPN
MEPFEGSGLWFSPDASDAPVPGILRISDRGDIRLSLIGSLGPGEMTQGEKRFPIILGSVEGPLGRNLITLVTCFRTGRRFGSFAGVLEEYLAHRGLFGAHFSRESDLAFRRLQIRVGGLRAWANPLSGFRPVSFQLDAQEAAPLLRYSMPSSVIGAIPGGEVSLGFMLSAASSLGGVTFTEEPAFSVTSETPLGEDEWNERFLAPLQNLMTFVCEAPQAVEGESLWLEDILAPLSENREIKVVGARVFPETEEKPREDVLPQQLLFTLEAVEPDFGSFIQKWLKLTATYADACNIFFGLQYAPPAFLDLTFAGVVQSLCLYYTRRADGVEKRTQEERRLGAILSRLGGEDADWIRSRLGVRPFPPPEDALTVLLSEHEEVMRPLLKRDAVEFVAEVTNTLRYVLWRDPEAGIVASSGADLHWMTAKLRILMKLCFLKELGFSKESVQAMFRENGLFIHIARLTVAQRQETASSQDPE